MLYPKYCLSPGTNWAILLVEALPWTACLNSAFKLPLANPFVNIATTHIKGKYMQGATQKAFKPPLPKKMEVLALHFLKPLNQLNCDWCWPHDKITQEGGGGCQNLFPPFSFSLYSLRTQVEAWKNIRCEAPYLTFKRGNSAPPTPLM